MRFYIKSYGCQMNVYDSQRICDFLVSSGHEAVNVPEKADLLIFNTCSIREKADDKLFSDLGRAKLLKKDHNGKNFIIVVAGCVAQSRSADIPMRYPYVDMIVGPQDIQNIPERVDDILHNREVSKQINLESKDKFEKINKIEFGSSRAVSEFLTIQEGCDNFCTYCVVPYTRGREFSRTVKEITNEAKKLTACGVKEIVLLGQNVSSYNGTGENGAHFGLAQLLWELSSVDGLKRLRYVTSNPKDVGEDIAKAHRDIPILMPFLHLPVQSGSNSILRKMNRKYSREKYFEVIDMLREYRPDMAFSSDFIVGFPGETDKDFSDTLELAERVKYSQAYSFKYSPRPRTLAASMPDKVPETVKSERLKLLQNLLSEQQRNYNDSFVGRSVNVLFSKSGKHKGQFSGKSEYFQSVTVDSGKVKVGDILDVVIKESAAHSLIGEIL